MLQLLSRGEVKVPFWRLCCVSPEASKQDRSLTSLTLPRLTFCTGVRVEKQGPLHTSWQDLELNCFMKPTSIFLAGSPMRKTAGEEFETLGRRFQASQHGGSHLARKPTVMLILPPLNPSDPTSLEFRSGSQETLEARLPDASTFVLGNRAR